MANIPDDVLEKVASALTAAVGITMVHAKEMNKKMLDASIALDDAINAEDADDE